MTVKKLEALELSDIVGSFLTSVIDAQAQSARATVAFVEEIGFQDHEDGQKLRTVSVDFVKKDENGQPSDFRVAMPLLAMVNVPSLAVKEAKLSFSYDVAVSATTENSSNGEAKKTSKIKGYLRKKSSPSSTASSTTNNTSNSSIDIDITLEQQEVPIGLERLFDLAELGITETKIETE